VIVIVTFNFGLHRRHIIDQIADRYLSHLGHLIEFGSLTGLESEGSEEFLSLPI